MDRKEDETTPSPKLKRGGTLSREQHELFVRYLTTKQRPPKCELKKADLLDSPKSMFKHGYGISGRFLAWSKRMTLRESDNALVFKKTGKQILYREQFEDTVRQVNESAIGTHLSFAVTLKKIREKYTMGKRQFGMNEDTVREILFTCTKANCPCKKVKKLRREDVIGPKPVRGTKSCSSLPSKTSLSSDEAWMSSLARLKEVQAATSRSSSDKKSQPQTASTETSTRAPLACYTVLNFADIVKMASKSGDKTEIGSGMRSNFILRCQNTNTVNQTLRAPASACISTPQQQKALRCLSNSFQQPTASVQPSTASVQPLSIQRGDGKSALRAIRPALDLSQRSILYRIYAHQQMLNNTSQTPSLSSPPNLLPCVRRQLINGPSWLQQAGVKVELASGPRSSTSASDLDWESFTSLSAFADALGGQAGLRECISKARETFDPRKQHQHSLQSVSVTDGAKNTGPLPLFKIQGDTSLPQPDMWYYYQDILQETHSYKRLVSVIDDMKLDVKQSLMGIRPSTERLKKKIGFAENLVGRCREITRDREKFAQERKKIRRHPSMTKIPETAKLTNSQTCMQT